VSLSIDRDYFDATGTYEVVLTATDEAGNTSTGIAIVTVEVDGVEAEGVHVLPTTLKRSTVAKVVVPFRSRIMEVQVMEAETNRYKVFKGNNSFEMEIDVAPFKGTLLVRIVDENGTIHLKKLIAL
ncbi:Ig-like domain-containing protein, partial [Longispora fulva]